MTIQDLIKSEPKTIKEITAKMDMKEPAVRNRVRRLIHNGIIEEFPKRICTVSNIRSKTYMILKNDK